MIQRDNIVPNNSELPSDFADRLGIHYTNQVSQKYKKELGQFFTPTPIAKFMASFCEVPKNKINILDPGCGTTVLACALIEKLVATDPLIEQIKLVVYEIDLNLISLTQQSIDFLAEWLKKHGIKLEYTVHTSDFILDNAKVLEEGYKGELFDVIISNPPYFKLAKDDKKSIAANVLVSGQPNIYSLFMGISAKLLVEYGELIFITPRSFASGNYFKAFRNFFFTSLHINKIHLFDSRKSTFNRDSVLQETVIIKATKEKIDSCKSILVSSSSGISDILDSNERYFKTEELIDLNSSEKILHLPTNDKEEFILNLVSTWSNTLSEFNINVSTGPVVAFRALTYIQNYFENGTVFLAPLFWLHNVNKMSLEWPKQLKDKGQYIRVEKGSKSLLIPNKNYILLRRFSTKDDKSRLIAAPYFSNYLKANFIGVENKVNYLYRKGGHLERNEVVGLCALLNSELFDSYFQIFNGNVNVSATELREMRFPTLNTIKEIGNEIILTNDYSMYNVNCIINKILEVDVTVRQYE